MMKVSFLATVIGTIFSPTGIGTALGVAGIGGTVMLERNINLIQETLRKKKEEETKNNLQNELNNTRKEIADLENELKMERDAHLAGIGGTEDFCNRKYQPLLEEKERRIENL